MDVIRRWRRLLLPLVIGIAAFWAVLFSAANVTAQGEDEYHLLPIDMQVHVEEFQDNGCWQQWRRSTGTTAYIRIEQDMSCSNSKSVSLRPLFSPVMSGAQGIAIDYSVHFYGSRSGVNTNVYWSQDNQNAFGPFVQTMQGDGVVSGRACVAEESEFAGFVAVGCDWSNGWTWWNDGSGINLNAASHDTDSVVNITGAYWIMPGPAPIEHPEIGGFCVFTATVPITSTEGLTGTQTFTYTRPVNRLTNASFELQSGPETSGTGWNSVVNGAVTSVPGHWLQLPGIARTGQGVVRNIQSYELWQPTTIYSTGTYIGGFWATGPGVQFEWNGAPVASSSTVQDGYDVFSGTHAANSGSGVYMILSFDGTDPTYVDDAFMYYGDPDTMEPICDSQAFEPFNESDADAGSSAETDGIGGLPTPIGGAGTVCYNCILPTDASAAAVSYWIAWLGCVLRNMFSCSLRVWLLIVGNWINGVIQYFIAFSVWVPLTAQQAADWFMGDVVPGIGGTFIINEGTNFFDLLLAIIGLIQSLITTISNLLLGVINLVISLLQLIPEAMSAEAFEFEFAGGSPGGGTGTPGPNDDKRLYAFLLFLSVVDQVVVGHSELTPILLLAMGAITLLVILWVGYFWKDVIQI